MTHDSPLLGSAGDMSGRVQHAQSLSRLDLRNLEALADALVSSSQRASGRQRTRSSGIPVDPWRKKISQAGQIRFLGSLLVGRKLYLDVPQVQAIKWKQGRDFA